ncbi:MAG: hypothetical protein IKT98_04995 [Selenomonadaceae bacterium]|nr:hypothetical protein [Selenomonadaceae bacterium]
MSSATEELLAEGRHEGEAIGLAKGEAIGLAKGEAIGLAKGEAIGLAKGEAIGLTKGEAIGTRKTLLENVRHLMINFRLTAEAAMNALGISPEMQKELAPIINEKNLEVKT